MDRLQSGSEFKPSQVGLIRGGALWAVDERGQEQRYDTIFSWWSVLVSYPTISLIFYHSKGIGRSNENSECSLMDPITHRIPCSKLAQLTGGRCFNVRYRLAPQNAFPSALLDAFISYLYLLSPPPSAFHQPVPAKRIVLSGDSAGGGLAMALLQLILQLHRNSSGLAPQVRFHGQDVEVPIPGGVSIIAGWLDMTRCLPSLVSNAQYDYLPPPKTGDLSSYFPKCPVWPTDPPRGDLYCDVSMLRHPLVSPLAAKDWKGSCPVRFAYGTEMLSDEGKVVAQKMAQQGGTVVWEEYDAMPHCFCMIMEKLEASKICLESWAQFAKDVVEGKELESKGTFLEAKTYKKIDVDVLRLEMFREGEVDSLMKQAQRKRFRGEEGETKALPRM